MVKEDKIVRGKNLGQLGTIIKSYLQTQLASNKGVVWVTYNSSSWEDIDTAWRNGKLVCCKYGGMVYQLIWDGTSTPVDYIFVHLSANYLRKLKCSTTLVNNQPSGTTWSHSETKIAYFSDIDTAISGKEDKSNKVTSLSSSSNNTQYPSALCVYNLISGLTSPFTYEVVSVLPTAETGTMGIIYVLTDGTDADFYITAEDSGSYSWEKVGELDTAIATITNGEIDALFE